MEHLQILWKEEPDDPFDEYGAILTLEEIIDEGPPPEELDIVAADWLLESIEIARSGLALSEPPEMPPLDFTV